MNNTQTLSPQKSEPIFQQKQLLTLDKNRIPSHIAFIPDGNRRWAKQQHLPPGFGHEAGASNLLDIVFAAKEIGIKVITFYIFSTENWVRDPNEVQFFLCLLESWLIDQRQTMIDNGVRLRSIGDISKFPKSIHEALETTEQETSGSQDIDLVVALNYGGRDEICRAVNAICQDYAKNIIKPDELTEATISKYLDTAPWKDPDLLIRTSGEMRFSNFLIWQTSYTEVFISDVLWPDFTSMHLLEAVSNYQKRERRWGGR